MLREYIVPDISKEDFRSRLQAAFDDSKPASQVDAPQAPQTGAGENVATGATASASLAATSTPAAPSRPQPEAKPASNETQAHREDTRAVDNVREPKKTPKQEKSSQSVSQTTPKQKEEERKTSQPKQPEKRKAVQERKGTPTVSASHNKKTDDAEPRPRPKPGPPTQYRLQVRLFDGSSIRSSFAPSQTISRDVRPWINQQTVESHPYNLKHILTPLPNRTLTIVDEEQTLQELNLGATANLVMVPIQSYSEAYAGLGPSIPVRAASTAYDIASNAVGTATGFIGSWLGYGQTAPATAATAGSPTGPAGRGQTAGRPAASQNSNIRTLADQRREQGDSQLYNGNQVCLMHSAGLIIVDH